MKKRILLLLMLLAVLLCSVALAQSEAPRVKFYISSYIAHLDRDVSVVVQCSNPASITSDHNTFELRDQYGQVLCTKKWTNPRQRLTFRFKVEESMLGGRELSVWHEGVQVTEATVHAAFSDLSVKRITQLEPSVPAIALTIVCGGGMSDKMDAMLAVLDKYDVKATFFINGGYLNAHLEDAKRIVAAGHELGSHGYQHVHMTQMNNYRQMRNVITIMNQECEEKLGVRPRLFRAPYSESNAKVTALCRAEGMEDIHWNIDSQDWADKYKNKPEAVVKRVTGPNAVSGSVIQFHLNGYNSAAILDQVIPIYQQEFGYQVVTVTELMALSGRELPPLP